LGDLIKGNIFEVFNIKGMIFKNREVLRYSYIPESLPHREKEMVSLARILMPALNGDSPSNIMIFGMTGTGKTVVSKMIKKALTEKSDRIERSISDTLQVLTSKYINDGIQESLLNAGNFLQENLIIHEGITSYVHKPIKCIYINCQQLDTHYRILTQIANRLCTLSDDHRLPVSGLPLDEVYNRLIEKLERSGVICIVILDEIDRLIYKSGDDTLYTLTRINEELTQSRLSIIGISNKLNIHDYLDPRVQSSLGSEELVFKPYLAPQLKDILMSRAKEAFYEESIDEDVIMFCSALAAQENGDARKALDLLRVSAELAERDHSPVISDIYVKQAQKKIEMDRVNQVVKSLPFQTKLVLYSILQLKISGRMKTTTREVIETYSYYSSMIDVTVLGRRQVVNLMNELDKLGLIQTKVISFGRHGRTTVIEANIPAIDIINLLNNGLLSKLRGIKPKMLYSSVF